MSGPSADPCRTKVDNQRAADWQLQHFVRQKQSSLKDVILFFLLWKKMKVQQRVPNAFLRSRNYFANNTFSSKLRLNLSLEQPNISCSGIVSLFLLSLSKCGFSMIHEQWVRVSHKNVSTYSLTCLRQGTEFLMQVPVRMSTLSTMTNGFSSRVTMERWFSSASSSP